MNDRIASRRALENAWRLGIAEHVAQTTRNGSDLTPFGRRQLRRQMRQTAAAFLALLVAVAAMGATYQ